MPNEELEVVNGKEFTGDEIVVDGYRFVDCTLRDCIITFRGGEFAFKNTEVESPEFRFAGSAHNTLEIIQFLYRTGFSSEVGELLDELLQEAPGLTIQKLEKEEHLVLDLGAEAAEKFKSRELTAGKGGNSDGD